LVIQLTIKLRCGYGSPISSLKGLPKLIAIIHFPSASAQNPTHFYQLPYKGTKVWQQEIIHLGKPTTIDIDMHITIDNKSRMLKLVSHQKKGE